MFTYKTQAKYFTQPRIHELNPFLGLDLTLNKTNNHAVFIQNYLRKDKNLYLEKRYGVNNVFNFKYKGNVWNIFYFIDKNGKEHTIYNLDGSLYSNNKLLKENAVLNKKVFGYTNNNRLYILGGINYLMINENEEVITLSNSKYVYTPTTSIGIGAKRDKLDDINMLTYWRKNKIITQDKEEFVYKLDSNIIPFNKEDISKMEIRVEDNVFKAIKVGSVSYKDKLYKSDNVYLFINNDIDIDLEDKSVFLKEEETYNSLEPISKSSLAFAILLDNGELTLIDKYKNELATNNVVIKFPVFKEERNKIDSCYIGNNYTANNFTSLFCTGNPDCVSTDFHSEMINKVLLDKEELENINEKDLVYFPDTSYCVYGSDNTNPIVGYDNLGTGQLLVMKKYQLNEPTIYFRSANIVKVGKALGSELVKQEYSLINGNIGCSAVSNNTIINFNGDTLFLDNNSTIQGLDKETQTFDNQRYSHSRSLFIDKCLEYKDLTNSFFYTNGNYLYFVNDNEIFVNDYGNKTNNAYEWYRLAFDFNIRSLTKIKDTIYIGTDKGEIFKVGDSYQDNYIISEPSLTLLTGELGRFNIERKLCAILKENDKLISNTPLLSELENYNIINDILITNKDIFSEKIIYQNKEYKIKRIEPNKYKLTYLREKPIIEDLDINKVYQSFYNIPIEKVVINETESYIKFKNINEFALINQSISKGVFKRFKNVVSDYITIPLTFGRIDYFKNISKITLINSAARPCEVSINYIDDDISFIQEDFKPTASYGYNLENINYDKINYLKNKVPLRDYSFRVSLIRKKYLMFRFYNDNDTNSILDSVLITYSNGTKEII